jgi:hypothetical protein
MNKILIDHSNILATMENNTFNIFEAERIIGRPHLMNSLMLKITTDMKLNDIVNEEKLLCFFDNIYVKYRRDVQYHNDLHGVDVCQMVYRMLTAGNLCNIMKLNKLDVLSFLTAAICHDVGHDGMNNSYHSNACTMRAINSNDVSVQETYHAAEVFKTLQEDCSNFTEALNKQEFKLFRKRVIGVILATDMAKHTMDLSQLKQTI